MERSWGGGERDCYGQIAEEVEDYTEVAWIENGQTEE